MILNFVFVFSTVSPPTQKHEMFQGKSEWTRSQLYNRSILQQNFQLAFSRVTTLIFMSLNRFLKPAGKSCNSAETSV